MPVGSLVDRDYMFDQERGGQGFAASLGLARFDAGFMTLEVGADQTARWGGERLGQVLGHPGVD